MININNKITELRKAQSWSQEELAKKIGASRIMIGKYERGENSPSIEVALKLANAFGVSIDYLVGQGPNATFDKEMIKRLDDLEVLPKEEKLKIFDYIDLVIRDFKTSRAYAR